jgi:hypothetical protein
MITITMVLRRMILSIQGIQMVHCMRNTGRPYIVETRNLSCFCKYCNLGDGDGCDNPEYVQGWKRVELKCTFTKLSNPFLF